MYPSISLRPLLRAFSHTRFRRFAWLCSFHNFIKEMPCGSAADGLLPDQFCDDDFNGFPMTWLLQVMRCFVQEPLFQSLDLLIRIHPGQRQPTKRSQVLLRSAPIVLVSMLCLADQPTQQDPWPPSQKNLAGVCSCSAVKSLKRVSEAKFCFISKQNEGLGTDSLFCLN